MEVWVGIKDHPKYEASSFGRIRNVKTGRILKQFINDKGYFVLSLDGKSQRVHRLIADSFYDGRHDWLDVNHIDGNKQNNHISNLEFCTRSENIRHAFNNGLSKSNLNDEHRSIGNSIMKEKTSRPVRVLETGVVYPSINECARSIGGHRMQILMCCRGEAKTHHGLHFEFVDA